MFTQEERVQMATGLLEAGIGVITAYRLSGTGLNGYPVDLDHLKLSMDSITQCVIKDLTELADSAKHELHRRNKKTRSIAEYTTTETRSVVNLMDMDKRMRSCLTVVEDITSNVHAFLLDDPADDRDALNICIANLQAIQHFAKNMEF